MKQIGKKAAVAVLMAAGMMGMAGVAEAATGVVNVQAVLSGSADYQAAGKKIVEERTAMQKDFAAQSKGMNDADKQALAQKFSKELAQKEAAAMKPVQEKLKAAVEKAAKDSKMDVVIPAGALMYGKADADLTEAVKANMK